MEELRGFISGIIYRNEENFYTVFEADTEDGTVTCTGSPSVIRVGETWLMTGVYKDHPTYGRQFAMDSFRVLPPEGKEEIRRFLSSGAVKGIGKALAIRITDRFKDASLKIIEEQPERLAEIRGISLNKARDIAAELEGQRDLRDAALYLQQFGITNTTAVRIWNTYGLSLYNVIRENPYRLADDIDGIGFVRADEIARRAGFAPDSDYRIRSGILYLLSTIYQEGSSYILQDDLEHRAKALLGVPEEAVSVQIGNLQIERRIVLKRGKDGVQVYSAEALYEEQQIARLLLELRDAEPVNRPTRAAFEEKLSRLSEKEHVTLDPLQEDAVFMALDHSVLLLTGGPGTGKTTTINTIIRYFLSEDMDVLLAAPTGRAAKRMTEATGYEARTIHRLLGVKIPGGEGGAGSAGAGGAAAAGGAGSSGGSKVNDPGRGSFAHALFEKGPDDPLEADAVIIDEMSMVDMHLMNALLKAILPGTRLICVGDENQLPSVGPGQVLRDLLDSGAFPAVHLKKIFRQAAESDIVMNAHRILAGEKIRLDTKSRDFFFLERDSAPVIYKHTVQLLRDRLPAYVHCDPMEIQVLTPMRKGPLGVEKLNEVLQETLNPAEPGKQEYRHGDRLYRTGDKVMQTRNDYQLSWKVPGRFGIPTDEGQGIFNGDFGVITDINVPAGLLTVRFDENRTVEYPFAGLDELELAYAVTVHKSQGSEYPAVILPLLSGPPQLMNRNLLYTAVTRAKSCVMILGSRRAVEGMIANTETNVRRTGLKERIAEILDAGN